MQNAFSAPAAGGAAGHRRRRVPVADVALGIVVFGDRAHISAGLLAMEAAGSPR